MKKRIFFSALSTLAVVSLVATAVKAQTQEYLDETTFAERNMGGPRLGITYVTNGSIVQRLKDNGLGNVISQFGWHFEYQIIPAGGGPSFVIQGIPFVGGVEYGTLVPSVTGAMGIRLPDGIEFGMGPNLLYAGKEGVSTSLVIAVGKSFNYGGVSIPLNLAFATNPQGNRVSFVFGYAIARGLK